MRASKIPTLVGIMMILGSIPCTLASLLIWRLTVSLAEGRAAGRDVGFDVIGVVMMSYFAFLIALGCCVVGLLYFGYAAVRRKIALKKWHWFSIAYSIIQVTIAFLYMSTR